MLLSAVQIALPALAAEAPYNPAIGSRWTIESESRTDEVRADGPRQEVSRERAEMTVLARAGAGFRIRYVIRESTVEGTSPRVALKQAAIKPLENMAVEIITDAGGRPIEVVDLADARKRFQGSIDLIIDRVKDKPQLADLLRKVTTPLLAAEGESAAAVFSGQLPQLAQGQNTGLTPGEVRRHKDDAPNPFGSEPLASEVAFRLVGSESGRAVYEQTRRYDPETLRVALGGMAKRLLLASNEQVTPEALERTVKVLEISLDERVRFEVEDGMTRKLVETTAIRSGAMGRVLTRTTTTTITVRPAG
jgi:hypothetical protein